jgi:hypothetical protein
MEEFVACFADATDPRQDDARHNLHEILMSALCTLRCGGKECSDMAVFGEAKEPFLRQFLTLKHGIPSHDTFSRVVPLLAPEEMLSLKDCIVTADARNCQRAIAAKVVEQGADYLLALKPISPACMNDIRRFLNDTQRTPDATHGTIDADHGRIETRTSTVCTDTEWLQELHAWPGWPPSASLSAAAKPAEK